MKFQARQIPEFLKAPDKQAWGALLYGPDAGQVREHGKTIAAKVVADPADPFNVVELTEEGLKADPVRLSDELFALSLMGGKRLVKVEASGDAVGKLIAEIYESDRQPEAYLLVLSDELPPRSALRSLFEGHAKLAALPCYKDEAGTIDQLVRARLDEAQIRYPREVVSYLAQNLGADRRVTLNEVEKIILYAGDEPITLEDVITLVGNSAELTLDDVCEAVAGGEFLRLEKSLQKLLQEGLPPVVLIRALQRYFAKLQVLDTQVSSGMSMDEAIAQLKPKVFFKQVPALKRHIARWKRHLILQAQAELVEVERQCKQTGSPAETLCSHSLLMLATLPARAARAA